MSFVNTVETVGDAALAASILDRSITEIADDFSTSIGKSAFRGCSALAKINFPSVTSVGLAAFWQCAALSKAEFASCVTFANNAFYGCTALTELVLWNTEQISTVSGTPFVSSAIAAGTGYIYVPAALVDAYKADSGWSAYADQIRALEDYPAIGAPYTWEGVFANIDNGDYASVYKVGDSVPLDLGDWGVVNMEIAAIDTDTKADGSGKAPISWVSREVLKEGNRWNPAIVTNSDGTYQEGTGTIGGWEKSELRAYLNSTVLPLIPSFVSQRITAVTKESYGYNANNSGTDYTSEEVLWIPGMYEVMSTGSTYGALLGTNALRLKCNQSGTAMGWALRDAANGKNFYRAVDSSGSTTYFTVGYDTNAVLCFCT